VVKWVRPDEVRQYTVIKPVRKTLTKLTFENMGDYKEDHGVVYVPEEDSVILGALVWVGHPSDYLFEGGWELSVRAYPHEEGAIVFAGRYVHMHKWEYGDYKAIDKITEDKTQLRMFDWALLVEEEEPIYYGRDAKLVAKTGTASLPVEAWDMDIKLLLAQKR